MPSTQNAPVRHGFPGQRMFVLPRATVAASLRDPHGLGLLPTDVGHFPRAAQHRVARPQGAAQLIVIYCTAGAGWVELDGRTIDVNAGETLLVPSGTPHAYGASPAAPWTVHWMHLAGPAVRAAEAMFAANPLVHVGHDAELAHRFERVFHALCESQTPASLLHASLIAAGILDRLIVARGRAGRADDMHDRMTRAIHLMWRRVSGRVSLDELAEAAGLSASHFAASFRRHSGAPPLEYFGRLQMQQAARLLDDTALPVKAVAARVGYADPLYFSRRFHTFQGMSPTRYRASKARRDAAAR